MVDYAVEDGQIFLGGAADPIDARLIEFRPALARYFRRRLRNASDVDDFVQEVFVRIAARRGGAVDNVGGYVFQTAASVLADGHRRRTVRHADAQVPFDSDRHSEADFDAGRIVEGREALRTVASALTTLPETTRTIFLMRRLDGQTYKDIASNFGISVSAVEKRMVRAVAQLRTLPGCALCQ